MEQKIVPDEMADADERFESMRSEPRDSMFLMAAMRRVGGGAEVQTKVRNLSPGGMMAESPISLSRGDQVEIDLRGIGVVLGRIAWTAGGRIGVQFETSIDPRLARKPVSGNSQQQLVRPSRAMWRPSIR